MRGRSLKFAILGAVPLLSACAGAKLPELKTSALSKIVTANHPSTVPAQPIEIYQRIASRAAKCWFGPTGPLRQSHIFHAIVQSPAEGGTVEIGILKRTPNPKKPWGAKVYAIVLRGTTSTDLVFQNFGLDLKTQAGVKADALAWANGKTSCTLNVSPLPPPQAPSKRRKR